ncbi:MAG TPA: hypothetical protein PLV25_07220, partial [Opitutales bacterium]|nr:hypothetical protein [Opitutales bacterium]
SHRAMLMTALNNGFAFITFSFILCFYEHASNLSWYSALAVACGQTSASFMLGVAVYLLLSVALKALAQAPKPMLHLVVIAFVIIAAALAHMCNASSLIVLLTLGIFCKKSDASVLMLAVDLNPIAYPFYVILLMYAGSFLAINLPILAIGMGAMLIVCRIIGKAGALGLSTLFNHLSLKSNLYLGLTLLPMTSATSLIIYDTVCILPEVGSLLGSIFVLPLWAFQAAGASIVSITLKRAKEALA